MLEVVGGPAAGTRLALAGETLLFGRSQDGPGALGGDGELSREHARVRRLPEGLLLVEDLGSTNGTFVNGNRIPAPTVMSPGDELAVGGSTLRLLIDDRPGAAAAAPPPKEKRLALRVVAGWAPGAHIPLEPGGVTLGQEGPAASTFAGDAKVAAEHVRVSPAGERALLIEDLGAPGGTLVGGAPIPAPTLVKVGERFQIGDSTLEVVEAAGGARAVEAERSLVLGGVRQVPEGLFARIAMRAPVSRGEVIETALFALGWALALNLLLRLLALDALDVDGDVRSLKVIPLLMASVFPVTFNALGFYKLFRRPDATSVRRYLVPTFVVPALFVAINLLRTAPDGGLEALFTIVVTVLPVIIGAPLMLRLRDRVARRRVTEVRGA